MQVNTRDINYTTVTFSNTHLLLFIIQLLGHFISRSLFFFFSPNLVRTVRRTILRFLTDLLMRCKLQPELRCAGCTQTRVHMLTFDTCSLSSIRSRKPRQWTPRLVGCLASRRFSPRWYRRTERLCHALIDLLVFICWVPQITLTLPQVHKRGHFLRSERLKTFTPSAMCCCPSFVLLP